MHCTIFLEFYFVLSFLVGIYPPKNALNCPGYKKNGSIPCETCHDHTLLVRYWFSYDFSTQCNPFCTSIISSNQITRANADNIVINNGRCYQRRTYVGWCKCHDELRIATSLYPYFIFKICFCAVFPQRPVQPSTECTCTETLHYDPILFFDRICYKTQSQTNRHTSIDHHICRGQQLPPSICLLSTCALNPSLR